MDIFHLEGHTSASFANLSVDPEAQRPHFSTGKSGINLIARTNLEHKTTQYSTQNQLFLQTSIL